MKKILIISDSALHKDPRILIQIAALQDDYQLTCIGRTHPGAEYKGEYVVMARGRSISRFFLKQLALFYKRLGKFSRIHLCESKFIEATKALKNQKFDLILCNDLPSAPLAYMLKEHTGGKIYLDAHEFTPRQWEGMKSFELKKPYLTYIMEEYATKADYGTTVCQSIADFYTNDYDFSIDEVVMNLPKYNDLSPSEVNPDEIRIVHHGIANRSRKLENLVDVFKLLDSRFTLDFYLVNNGKGAHSDLVEYAKSEPRIRFRDAVGTADLPSTLNKYDIGLYPLVPAVPNQEYALPNKFFEFLQARLAIAIWPSIEMKNLLIEHDLGVVSENYSVEELASLINALSAEDIAKFKKNSDEAAKTLNADDSLAKIAKGVAACLNK